MKNHLTFNFVLKSKFINNVLTLMTGTILAQGIGLLAYLILSRLYLPNDFGVLALFISIYAILSVISGWRYEQAIILPKEEKQAVAVLSLTILIISGMTFLSLLIVIFGRKAIANILNSPMLLFWLWFLPMSIFFMGFYQVLNFWFTRKKKFKHIAISQISRSGSREGSRILIGVLIGGGVGGLIVGEIAGIIIANITLCFQLLKDDFLRLLKSINKADIWASAVKYRKFPYYDTWAGLLDTISQIIPIWLLGYFFPAGVVGSYFFADKILRAPIQLISQSTMKVYFQKTSEYYSHEIPLKDIFIKTTKGLFLIGILPFFIMLLIGKPLFIFIFGINWGQAGAFAQILSIWTFLMFINPPARVLFTVYQKQNILLISNVLLVLFILISMLGGHILSNGSEIIALISFVGIHIIYNIWMIIYGYNLSKSNK